MTPKEKAKDLVMKFNDYTVIKSIHFPNGKIIEWYSDAKQSAFIAVDEILDTLKEVVYAPRTIEYWQEVKQEIEKV